MSAVQGDNSNNTGRSNNGGGGKEITLERGTALTGDTFHKGTCTKCKRDKKKVRCSRTFPFNLLFDIRFVANLPRQYAIRSFHLPILSHF